MKIHMYEPDTEINMPFDIKKEFYEKGQCGSLCGYMRATTKDPEKVTCFFCKKLMIKAYGER